MRKLAETWRCTTDHIASIAARAARSNAHLALQRVVRSLDSYRSVVNSPSATNA